MQMLVPAQHLLPLFCAFVSLREASPYLLFLIPLTCIPAFLCASVSSFGSKTGGW